MKINSWYILINEQKHGPYDYKHIIHLLQRNELMDYNYVWAPHLDKWTPIHRLEDFNADRLRLLMQNDSEINEAFIRRQRPRARINRELIGHNGLFFFDGELLSVSSEGALCQLNNPLIQLRDSIKLIVKNLPSERSFSAEAVIVRKNHTSKRLNSQSGLQYVLCFKEIQKIGHDVIHDWVSEVRQ